MTWRRDKWQRQRGGDRDTQRWELLGANQRERNIDTQAHKSTHSLKKREGRRSKGVVGSRGENRGLRETQSRQRGRMECRAGREDRLVQTCAEQGGALGGSGIWLLIS